MSTNDVPGAKAANNDQLAMGCWAEHDDGSLIFVKSVEGNRVIYEMYDTSADPIVQYTDAMLEDAFKNQFTWKPTDKNSIKWVWHDKTPFPWDRVIKAGAKDGAGYASAQDQLSAAARVAMSLALRGKDMDPEDIKHMMDQIAPAGSAGESIVNKLQAAISELPTDDRIAKKKRKILEKATKRLARLG